MNVTQLLVKRTSELIYSVCFKEASRKKPTDFTRDRKMPFEEVILFIQQQSFSEARAKSRVEAFIQLFNLSVEVMRANCRRTWHGYRLLAVDGSKIALPADKKLLKQFGGTGKHASSPTAQGSIAYDVLNDIVTDALLAPLSTDERNLAVDAQTCPDGVVWLEQKGKRIRVRVIKFKLDSGRNRNAHHTAHRQAHGNPGIHEVLSFALARGNQIRSR